MILLYAVILYSAYATYKFAFVACVFAGLLFDLYSGSHLGKTSLFFLAVSVALHLYKKKLTVTSKRFLFPFGSICIMLYSFYEYTSLYVGRMVLLALFFWAVVLLTWFFVIRLWNHIFLKNTHKGFLGKDFPIR